MKKQKENVAGSAILRQQAEKLVKNKQLKNNSQLVETDTLRLVHELQVHQIELELQNEEFRRAKEEAEDASQKYTELYDSAPTGYFTLTKDGVIVELNLGGAKMLGKPRSVLINSVFTFFVSNDTKSFFNLFLHKIFGKKYKHTCEITLSIDDKLPVYVFIKGIISKNGEHCIINVFDISKRIRAEKALRKSEELNRNIILQTAMDGFWLVDMKGILLEVNETYCRMSGYSAQELLLMHIADLEAVESENETVAHMQKILDHGEDFFESRHRRKDGSFFDVEISVQYQTEKGGRFVVFVRDITSRKQAEQALIESEKRYRSLFEQGNDAIFLVDISTGCYIDCNRMAETLTEYARYEIIGMKTGSFLPPPRKGELESNIEVILSGKVLMSETEITTRSGKLIPVEFNSSMVIVNNKQCILSMLHDISKRRSAEVALKQSEERVRFKLQSILSPEGSIADLELNDIIDVPSIQQLLDNFYQLVQIPMAIIDLQGKVLVGVGWQDICTKFHRVHPQACRNCFESDVHLTKGITDGEFMLYKCKNNMWDMATPLIIGGEHKGNLYLGQFFFKHEPIDYAQFSKQAQQYGFDEQEYLAALRKVPRLGKHKIKNAKSFFLNLSRSISQLSYSNIKLAKAISQEKKAKDELKEKEELLNKAEEIAHLGSWSLDLNTNLLTWSDEIYRIFNVLPQEFHGTYEEFLDSVHPDDREKVNSAYANSIKKGKDSYEVEHRIFRKHSGELRYILEKCEHIRDASGKIIRSVGMAHDITNLKHTEEALKKNVRLFRESQAAANIGSYSSDLVQKTWTATPAIYEIFGIDESHPNTLDAWVQSVHPDFREELVSDLLKKEKRSKVFEHEYKIIRVSDGAERWVHGLGKFEFDNQMNPVGLIGTIQDITNRKLAEEALKQLNEELEDRVQERTSELLNSNIALQQAEEKYRTIADYNYDWETWLDTEGKYVYVSPSCYRISGYSVDEFMNDPTLYFKIAHPDDREMIEQHYYESLKPDNPDNTFDFRIITRNGEEKWISHRCQSVYDTSGKWLGQRGSNNDITERKKVENFLVNSQDKLRALTQHMNEVTENERKNIAREIHDELGHMLTALKYDIDNLMCNSELTLELVKNELPVIIGMVESLIDSVKKIATELRPGILDHLGLFPAMEWQINQFKMMTKIKCTYIMPRNLDVSFDKNETTTIFRILQEILTNVARHSKANEVVISVDKKTDTFYMNVYDNGIGFKLKDKFLSVSLGILGMQERALSIGGEIQIESTPGKGTSVTLLLSNK